MVSIKVKTVTWQLEGTQELTDEGSSNSSVLGDSSLLSLSRALGRRGLSTCMCLDGLSTRLVVAFQLANANQSPVAVTNGLLRYWKGLKRDEAAAKEKERDMVRALERALRYSGRSSMADVLVDRFADDQPLTDDCWKQPSSGDFGDF